MVLIVRAIRDGAELWCTWLRVLPEAPKSQELCVTRVNAHALTLSPAVVSAQFTFIKCVVWRGLCHWCVCNSKMLIVL